MVGFVECEDFSMGSGLTSDQRRACFEAAREVGADEGVFVAFADSLADVDMEVTAQTLIEAWRDGPGASQP